VARLRRRAAGLVVGALVLFLVGTNVQAGWLFVIGAFLLGAAGAGVLLPGRMLRGVEIARRAPEEVQQGDPAAVELTVTNRSRGMRASLIVEDSFLEATTLFVSHVAPGERLELTTARTAARRGPQGAAPVILRTEAPFGVAERRRRIDASGVALVLPRVEPLGDLPFIDRAPTLERALHTYPRRGGGPEYLGIREYRPGDSMRHVHWPSTARHGSVMVREFEQEQTRRLAILVDTVTDTGEEWTPLDAACSAAASVGLAATALGHGVRLVTAAPGGEVRVLARADDRELLEALATVRPSGITLGATLSGGLRDTLRGIETVLLVTPSWRVNAGPALAAGVRELVGEVGRVAALVVDAGSWGAPEAAVLPPAGVAELLAGLAGAGADAYRWARGVELASVLDAEPGVPA
jgi:uncharacterized protein (DUF58 family)